MKKIQEAKVEFDLLKFLGGSVVILTEQGRKRFWIFDLIQKCCQLVFFFQIKQFEYCIVFGSV